MIKARLFAVLALFFAFSLAAWSFAPGSNPEAPFVAAEPQWPDPPGCTARDRGDGSPDEGRATNAAALSRPENPIHTAFVEVNCLLASN